MRFFLCVAILKITWTKTQKVHMTVHLSAIFQQGFFTSNELWHSEFNQVEPLSKMHGPNVFSLLEPS